MGYDIDLHVGNYETLITKFMALGCTDRAFIEKTMNLLGIHNGDDYVILYNQYYSDSGMNPMEVLSEILDQQFNLPNHDGKQIDTFQILMDNTLIYPYFTVDKALEILRRK